MSSCELIPVQEKQYKLVRCHVVMEDRKNVCLDVSSFQKDNFDSLQLVTKTWCIYEVIVYPCRIRNTTLQTCQSNREQC